MESLSIFERDSLNSIGEKAWDIFASSSHGKILASFSRAIYLSSSRKELFWLTGEGSPMHRRSVEVRGILPGPSAGSTYRICDGTLEFEGGHQLVLTHREIWRPERIQTEGRFEQFEISRTLLEAMSSLTYLSSPKGFGCLLPDIYQMVGDGTESYDRHPNSPVLNLAWPCVRDIITAISLQNYTQVFPPALRLIGLGQGLTPSGDDYLGGLLFTWKILTKSMKKIPTFKQRDLDLFLAYAKRNTNIISYSILADHVHGYGSDTLHQFVNAMLVGEPVEKLQDLLVNLIAIGHSTGWDILAGVLTGILLGVGEKPAIQVT